MRSPEEIEEALVYWKNGLEIASPELRPVVRTIVWSLEWVQGKEKETIIEEFLVDRTLQVWATSVEKAVRVPVVP